MTTDHQVRRLKKLIQSEKTQAIAASKAGMDVKTARKYLRSNKLPSELKGERNWRTRKNPFEEDWEELSQMLKVNPGLQAKTLFQYLTRKHPGKYQDGQLRTLQDHVRVWRAQEGPPKEVFFPQRHQPGHLCQSDFTHITELKITIAQEEFPHLIYHFVLTYSNWESGTICFSESFESFSAGLQNALWELGGVPGEHRSDQFSAAIHQLSHPEEFTVRYQALLKHYGLTGSKIQVGRPNENGDVEQRHYRFKEALEQALLLRGSRDFSSREAYARFLQGLFKELNAGRCDRLEEELPQLRALPVQRLDLCKRLRLRVRPSSTLRLGHNIYSVPSRLIGEWVEARLQSETIEIWFASRQVETLPRLRGEGKSAVQYRHIIDWLVRKPGAFENYLYRDDLFPSSRFRAAFDAIKESLGNRAGKEYVKVLYLASKTSEKQVENALQLLLSEGLPLSYEAVEKLVTGPEKQPVIPSIRIAAVNPGDYDCLLQGWEGSVCRN